jgi:hypothetical protein
MFFRHHTDKLIFPIIGLVLLVTISYRPTHHLRNEMPAAFFPTAANSKAGQTHGPEEKIAWAYWESAQMDIQWKYSYQHPLPEDPPPEFRVNAQALGPAASDPSIRLLYWRRLQQVWYLPEAWKSEYEWDFGWLSDPAAAAGQWIRDHTSRLSNH